MIAAAVTGTLMQAKASKIVRAVVVVWIFAANVFAEAESALSADQIKVLEQVRASALAYSHSLPDFICRQITERETSSVAADSTMDALSDGWNAGSDARVSPTTAVTPGDVIEEQLTFVGQKENYQVLTVNGKKAAGLEHAQLFGMISAGEFGSALEEIFKPASQTEFTWDRMGKAGDRRVYVFGFRVPKEHGATVMLRGSKGPMTVAYKGKVFVDAENLNVLRIRSALEVPPGSSLQKGESGVDYGPVEIAGKTYNLPLHSEVQMQDKEYSYMNKIDFKKYQKFVVESTIHYGSGSVQ